MRGAGCTLTMVQIVDLARHSLGSVALADLEALELRAEAVEYDVLAAALVALGGARRLKALRLVSSTRSLPPALTELRGLQRLELHDDELPGLPTGIARLTRLRSLKLDLFHLDSLPRSIAGLTRLRELHISSHHLRGLPDGLRALTELRALTLHLHHTYVHDWEHPTHFNPRFDQRLEDLFALLGALTSLSSLTLRESGCYTSTAPIFARLPAELADLHALEDLALDVYAQAIVLPPDLQMPAVRRVAGTVHLRVTEAELRAIFPNAELIRGHA
jgi:hypothetical protein